MMPASRMKARDDDGAFATVPRIPSTIAILLALACGVALALAGRTGALADSGIFPALTIMTGRIGQLYLNLIQLLTVPLIFVALARATSMLFRESRLGRTLWRATLFALATSLLGIFVALSAAHLFRPGEAMPSDAAEGLLRMGSHASREIAGRLPASDNLAVTLLAFVPETLALIGSGRLYLPVMLLAPLTGLLLGMRTEAARDLLSDRLELCYRWLLAITGRALYFSPLPIGCLIHHLVATAGLGASGALLPYIGVLLLAFTLQLTIVYFAAVWILAGIRPLRFLRSIREAMLVAFGTSSSGATLAVSLQLARDRLGISEPVGRFVLSAGTCLNQAGSAMFLGVSVIFLAQFFGIALSLWQHLIVIATCSIAAIGTVGVPGASITVIALTLAMIGVPVETISLILGVDRLMDMCRSMLNVTGDLAMAAVLTSGADAGERHPSQDA